MGTGECEQAFLNRPLLIRDNPKHSAQEERFLALGQANEGRRLYISFTLRAEKIRVISARDMNRKERETYEKAKEAQKDS